jgi:hypothetical protein
MQSNRPNLFRRILDLFRPKPVGKNHQSKPQTKKPRFNSRKSKRPMSKHRSIFRHKGSMSKLTRKMSRSLFFEFAHNPNKKIQRSGVMHRLGWMVPAEKQNPGRFTAAIREHREWLVANANK